MARSNSFVTKVGWITTIKSLFGISNEAGFRFFFMNYAKYLTDPYFLCFMLTFTHTSLMEPKVDIGHRDALLLFTGYAVDLYGTMMTDNPVLTKACAFQHRGALLLNKSHIPYSLEKEIYYQPNAASSNSQVFTSSLAQSLESDPTDGITFSYQTCVEAFELNDENIVFYPSRRITEPWI